jgi:UDP-N-acetylmuramyl pentapeptide phosphotransferase/UDP-N-acetylglucosamine-1-phosphate transferase
MNDFFYIIISFIISLVISAKIIPTVIKISHSLKLFDRPNARSAASHVVPTLGGIAIFLGFVFGITLPGNGYVLPGLQFIVAAVIIMFFVGLKDDIIALSPWKKLAAQIAASMILILLAKYRFTNLHGFLGIEEIGFFSSLLLTTFVMIVIINSFNLIDGIDGLAAGVSILAASVFGVWFYLSGHFEYSIIAFALIGALVGFFFFNVYGTQHKIFMGDTGSLILGLVMAVLVIQFNELNIDQTQQYAIASAPAVSFGILIYPLLDTIRVFTIRLLQRKSPFSPDKNHIHHRMLVMGLSHKAATYTIIAVNAVFIIPVFLFQNIGIVWLMIFNLTVSGLLVMIPALIIRNKELIQVNDPHQQIVLLSSKIFKPDLNNKIKQPVVTNVKLKHFKTQLQKLSLW